MILVRGPILGQSAVDWFQDVNGRDKAPGLKINLFEGPGFEVLEEFIEPSRGVRFLIPTNVNEVLVKILVVFHILLDPRHNLMFHLLPSTILDPAILDDTLLLRPLVYCLEHSCPLANCCTNAKVVE